MTATTPSSRSAQPSRSAISGMGTLSNPWSGMPRQRPAPSPLIHILGGHADAGDFTEDQLDRLRRHVAVATPRMPVPEMDEFLGQMFAQPEVVTAYFRPTPMVGRSVPPHATRMVLPFDHALRAAKRAAAMPVLWPQERGLAWLAAFVYPCGLFHGADPSLRHTPGPRKGAPADALHRLRYELLQDPLRQLRRCNLALGDTLAAALGLDGSDQCDAEQMARLVTAVRLATVELDQAWRGAGLEVF